MSVPGRESGDVIPVPMRLDYDCLRAAVASILEIDYDDTPDLIVDADESAPRTLLADDGRLVRFAPDWFELMQAWANSGGLQFLSVDFYYNTDERELHAGTIEDVRAMGWLDVLRGYWLGDVKTRIPGKTHTHFVVMHGGALAFDPQPDPEKKRGELLFVGATMFVPLDPARLLCQEMAAA